MTDEKPDRLVTADSRGRLSLGGLIEPGEAFLVRTDEASILLERAVVVSKTQFDLMSDPQRHQNFLDVMARSADPDQRVEREVPPRRRRRRPAEARRLLAVDEHGPLTERELDRLDNMRLDDNEADRG